jgi:putative transcriptional regulator
MRAFHHLALLAAGCLLGTAAAAQTLAPATGRIIVSTPGIEDAEFAETVVLILHHDEDGTLGVFLNRPTWVDPGGAFPGTDALQAYPGKMYLGGPVAPTQLLLLLESTGAPPENSNPIADGIYLSTDLALLGGADGIGTLRLYAGHTAWAPGQLDAEIGAGDWRVLTPRAGQILTAKPLELWLELANAESGLTADAGAR